MSVADPVNDSHKRATFMLEADRLKMQVNNVNTYHAITYKPPANTTIGGRARFWTV